MTNFSGKIRLAKAGNPARVTTDVVRRWPTNVVASNIRRNDRRDSWNYGRAWLNTVSTCSHGFWTFSPKLIARKCFHPFIVQLRQNVSTYLERCEKSWRIWRNMNPRLSKNTQSPPPGRVCSLAVGLFACLDLNFVKSNATVEQGVSYSNTYLLT